MKSHAHQIHSMGERQVTELVRYGKETLQEAAESGVRAMAKNWPSTDHPENIYAKDVSVKTWRIDRVDELTLKVVNYAKRKGKNYSGYVNRGTTRWKGPRSARPYIKRGRLDYGTFAAAEDFQRFGKKAGLKLRNRLK